MAPPRPKAARKQSKDTPSREDRKDPQKTRRNAPDQQRRRQNDSSPDDNQIDISGTIPLSLQQLLLNVFKSALLSSAVPDAGGQDQNREGPAASSTEEPNLDVKSLIQTIKSHLYNRDFDSAFTDAGEDILRAYALRWSAARALGYAGLFKSLLKVLMDGQNEGDGAPSSTRNKNHIVCIGGGAGAEIVALAAASRDLMDEVDVPQELSDPLQAASLTEETGGKEAVSMGNNSYCSDLSVTAVDIADWSAVVERLSATIQSPAVPASKAHLAPLLPATQPGKEGSGFTLDFKRLDVLSISDETLSELFHSKSGAPATMVTLMFTLNELFSTSMAKATAFLLRTTDLLQPGTILLVVDSPGSYSTLKLGKGGSGTSTTQERQYPMKFLLDHTLLSVAEGKWERIFSQDSRWWRRDAARLWYDVGEGAGLEDMRYQVHVYRRL